MGSKRSRPWGQRLMHSPQVRQRLSVTGSLRHTCRRTSISMGQLNEHMPHCTQRRGSGVTHAVARFAYFALSDLNQPTVLRVTLRRRRAVARGPRPPAFACRPCATRNGPARSGGTAAPQQSRPEPAARRRSVSLSRGTDPIELEQNLRSHSVRVGNAVLPMGHSSARTRRTRVAVKPVAKGAPQKADIVVLDRAPSRSRPPRSTPPRRRSR